MLGNESQSVRAAVLVLIMASMPVESNFDEEVGFVADTWTRKVLLSLTNELELSEEYFDGYVSLLKTNYRNYNFTTLAYESDENFNAESLNSIIQKFLKITAVVPIYIEGHII